MQAYSIFTIATLGENWITETFDRIQRGEATEIGNDVKRVSEISDNFFIALVNAIELARKGGAADIVHKSVDYEHLNRSMEKKLRLFKEGALMSITLTKKTGQLRGWIGGPRLYFWNDGTHVDEYGANGIFEVTGNFDRLEALAKKHLTREMRRFEDDKFVIWV